MPSTPNNPNITPTNQQQQPVNQNQPSTNQPGNQESITGDITEQETLSLLQELKNLYQQTQQSKDTDFETPETKTKISKIISDTIQLHESKIYSGKDVLAKKRLVYLTATTKTILNRIFGAGTINNLGNNIKNILDSVANMETVIMDLSDIKNANKKIIETVSTIVDTILLNNIQTITKNTTKTVTEVSKTINKSTNLILTNQHKLFKDYLSKKGFFEMFEYSMNQIYGSIRKGSIFGLLYYNIMLIKNSFIGLINDVIRTYQNIKEYFDKHYIQRAILKWLLFSPYAIGVVLFNKIKEREKEKREDLIKIAKEFQDTTIKKSINIEEQLKNYFSDKNFESFFKQSKLFRGLFKLSDNIDILKNPLEEMSNKELRKYIELMKKVKFVETIKDIENKISQVKTEEEKKALEEERIKLIEKETKKLMFEQHKKILSDIGSIISKPIAGLITGGFKAIKFSLGILYKGTIGGFNFIKGLFNFGGKVLNMFSLVFTAVKMIIEEFGSTLLYRVVFTIGFVVGVLSKLINNILNYFKDENGNYLTISQIAKKLFKDISDFITEKWSGFIDWISYKFKLELNSLLKDIMIVLDNITTWISYLPAKIKVFFDWLWIRIKNWWSSGKKDETSLSSLLDNINTQMEEEMKAKKEIREKEYIEAINNFLKDTTKEYQIKALSDFYEQTTNSIKLLEQQKEEINKRVSNINQNQPELKNEILKYIESTTKNYDIKQKQFVGDINNISNTQLKLLRGELNISELLAKLDSLEENQKKLILDSIADKKDSKEKIEALLNKLSRVEKHTNPKSQPASIPNNNITNQNYKYNNNPISFSEKENMAFAFNQGI